MTKAKIRLPQISDEVLVPDEPDVVGRITSEPNQYGRVRVDWKARGSADRGWGYYLPADLVIPKAASLPQEPVCGFQWNQGHEPHPTDPGRYKHRVVVCVLPPRHKAPHVCREDLDGT